MQPSILQKLESVYQKRRFFIYESAIFFLIYKIEWYLT